MLLCVIIYKGVLSALVSKEGIGFCLDRIGKDRDGQCFTLLTDCKS
jgi:hypothetical protein